MSEKKSKSENKLSTESYKGVRDFYPEDQKIQQYIFDTMRDVAESFGYHEYNTSPLEPSELYAGKTSEEIVNEQTYIFTDRGGRSVTLRPEMTPSVARLVASKRKALAFPQRLFSIPNVFRYERPQRGRLREHYQLNVDLFGIAGIDAEIEVISLAANLLQRFGLKQDQFEIRINDRKAAAEIIAQFGLSSEEEKALYRLIDKKDKITNFDEELEKIIGVGKTLEISPSETVNNLIEELALRGIKNVVFTPDLMRGFDYYTGIIFEIFDTNPENSRSLFGGGRYDNLLEIFGVEPAPTVGFGMGDVTIRDVLETYDLLPVEFSFADIYICVLGESAKVFADEVAQKLRSENLRTVVDLRYDTISNQLKRAEKEGAKWAVFIGEDEKNADKLPLKNLSTGEQSQESLGDIIDIVKKEKDKNEKNNF